MDLTPENKAKIDSMNYEEMLRLWRFSPAGTPMFEGATGHYFAMRIIDLRHNLRKTDEYEISHKLGWRSVVDRTEV